MQVRQLVATALVSVSVFGAASAMAQDDSFTNSVGTTSYSAHSNRSREAVVAELRNAQAQGAWRGAGELSEAPVSAPVPAPPAVLTRAQVKADVAQARASHQLPRVGELM
jgi:hypothetical protein